jgi:hypothetical protein
MRGEPGAARERMKPGERSDAGRAQATWASNRARVTATQRGHPRLGQATCASNRARVAATKDEE